MRVLETSDDKHEANVFQFLYQPALYHLSHEIRLVWSIGIVLAVMPPPDGPPQQRYSFPTR